jgi:hypothetical protein
MRPPPNPAKISRSGKTVNYYKIKRKIQDRGQSISWIERIAGTFRDDPEFDEIVRLGREFRESAAGLKVEDWTAP